MSQERYDLFRLYLANMEQYMMMKKVFNMVLVLLGVAGAMYTAVVMKNYSNLWLVFFVIMFFYFIARDFIAGIVALGPVSRTIRWASGQKLKEPDKSNAGELSITAAKLLRNGNVAAARQLMDAAFQLKRISPNRMMFANTVMADVLRAEGKYEKSIKTLKNNVLKKRGEYGCYSLFVLGRTYLQQGEFHRAIEAFQDANTFLKDGELGIPDLYKGRSKNRTLRNYYGEALLVFVPFYLGKSHYFAPDGDEIIAAENLNAAVRLCRNRFLRPLLKQDFTEQE